MKMSCLAAVLGMLLSACGSSSSNNSNPAAPSAPSYPMVAGNYSGSITITYQLLAASLNCPATTTITQSGANVSIAPLAMTGPCTNVFPSLPMGDMTINTSGSLGSATVNNISVASCNGSYNAAASGGFFGSSLQFSLAYTAASGGCVNQVGNFTIAGTLTRG
jgi:hypothetical protein